jgi:mevalonate-3-kinase
MFSESFTAIAYPTMGIVLLGGLTDPIKRLPYHNSAGICYSLVDKESIAKTSLIITESEGKNSLNGEPIDLKDTRSPFKIIDSYRNEFSRVYGSKEIYFNSSNENIISGSSDAGAAALGKCISSALNPIDEGVLETRMRMVSESAGRSYFGGLTVTEGTIIPKTKQILGAEFFNNIRIVSVIFPHKRKPSDDIHFNQPKSEYYKNRILNANNNVELLKKLALEKDIKSIYELAMKDTDDYHYLNSLVNVNIVTEEMAALMEEIKDKSKSFWVTYIVTGGNSVFIVTEKEKVSKVKEFALQHSSNIQELRVTGGSKLI